MSRKARLSSHAEALLAAFFFGMGTPLAKLLLGRVEPLLLAGLLYLGAGAAAALGWLIQRGRFSHAPRSTTPSKDTRWLVGAVLSGGVVAPILMMYGLQATPAGTASLLLNAEAVATTLIAGLVFREAIGPRVWCAVALVSAAAGLLAWRPGEAWGISSGALGIVGACAFWGLDNNLTRLVTAWDPLQIVCVKGLSAGCLSLVLGLGRGAAPPGLAVAAAALALGSVSFGLSIVLFIRALRGLGAARTGALFGTAPFVGALLSWFALGEEATAVALLAVLLMGVGAYLLLTEAHGHSHQHPELVHEHSHTHDDGHHDHVHGAGEAVPAGRHSHPHRHAPRRHDHPHAPDLHHRHRHPRR